MTITHHLELSIIDSSGDSFCAHLVTVLPVLRHDCARTCTTHPAVTVVPVLHAVLFDSIQRMIADTEGLNVANVYSKTLSKKEIIHWVLMSCIFDSFNFT